MAIKAPTVIRLRKYLEANPNRRFTVRDESFCVIGKYLRDQGAKDIRVAPWYSYYNGLSAEHSPGLRKFISAFDNSDSSTVSGKTALEILLKSAYRKL